MPTAPFELSDSKRNLLIAQGNILVLGGPGSGKTTIALLKAKNIIEAGIPRGRRVLFLSFARATITRVEQSSKTIINGKTKEQLEIDTYHGFCWKILRSHGYLLCPQVPLQLLLPPDAAARLAHLPKPQRNAEKQRLFDEHGLLHFDLFARLTGDLLTRSNSLATVIGNTYPYIILDEFQDTNTDEWRFIKALGQHSKLIALADLEQRIYEFRGADPARISHFQQQYPQHTPFDFGTENNRSNGTDIVTYGNDLLSGANRSKTYTNVRIQTYTPFTGDIHRNFKSEVLAAVQRLNRTEKIDWSLAILVPTNDLMISTSDYLSRRQNYAGGRTMPAITHDVAIEMAGPSLSATIISKLLEKGDPREVERALMRGLHDHMRGRKGDTGPSRSNLELSDFINQYLAGGSQPRKGSSKANLVSEVHRIAVTLQEIIFSGDPISDWIVVRELLGGSTHDAISQVAKDAMYLRLLRKGAVLNAGLSQLWRNSKTYVGAVQLVRTSLTQDYFSASSRTWAGVHVMTIHKAKGKEFDEVIIYEGAHQDRFLKNDPNEAQIAQSRLNLRVAVTRAIRQATILTPNRNRCPLI